MVELICSGADGGLISGRRPIVAADVRRLIRLQQKSEPRYPGGSDTFGNGFAAPAEMLHPVLSLLELSWGQANKELQNREGQNSHDARALTESV